MCGFGGTVEEGNQSGEESHFKPLEVSLQCGVSRLVNTAEKLTGEMGFKVGNN